TSVMYQRIAAPWASGPQILWNGSAMRTCPRAALSRPVRSGGTDGPETGLTSRSAHRARPRARTAPPIGNRPLPLRAALVVRLQRLDNGQHLVGGEQHRRGGRLLDRQVAVLGGVDLRCECSVDGRAHVYAPFRRARQRRAAAPANAALCARRDLPQLA